VVLVLVALVLAGNGCGDDARTPADPSSSIKLDEENLLNGNVRGQGFGRFSDVDGTPDADGSDYDLQSGQIVTSRLTGVLSSIRLPIRNISGATAPVFLQLRALQNGIVPEPDDDLALGTVSLAADAFVGVQSNDPETWAEFDVSAVGLELTPGRKYCFTVSTDDTLGFIYNVEFTMNYPQGDGFRRNQALTGAWSAMDNRDFGFQTYVDTR
jgi:hypothetical protein